MSDRTNLTHPDGSGTPNPGRWLANALSSEGLKLALAMLATLVFYKFGIGGIKFFASTDYWFSYPLMWVLVLGTFGIAVWQSHLRYAEMWIALRILSRAAGAIILVQCLFDALYPSAWQSHVFMGQSGTLRIVILLACIAGAIAMWRPSFLLPLGATYFCFRYHVPVVYEVTRTSLDFQVLADAATFPASAVIAWSLLGWLRKSAPNALGFVQDANKRVWEKSAWAIIVGAHLGNYFHSAMAKIYIGGPEPLFWLFNNTVQNTLSLGLFRYNSPIAQWPEVTQLYFDFMAYAFIPMNIAVFLFQFLAPMSVLNRRVLIAFTLFFDAMHIGIYLSLGVFFFFWVALNVIILTSLAKIRDEELDRGVKLTAIAFAFWGYFFFYQANLGWLDGRKVVRENFYAVTSEGNEVLVPPAVTGLFAYQMAHGDLYIPEGHYLMRAGGNATISDWDEASQCLPNTEPEQAFVSLPAIERVITHVDEHFRRYPWVKDWNLYYWYPHHSPSNPVFFGDYEKLSVDDIVGYKYVVESACLELENGRLKDDIRIRTEFDVEPE